MLFFDPARLYFAECLMLILLKISFDFRQARVEAEHVDDSDVKVSIQNAAKSLRGLGFRSIARTPP